MLKIAGAALLVLGVLPLPACTTVETIAYPYCLEWGNVCWGPYAPATKTFYLEIRDNALRNYECASPKCPKILALAEEHVKSKGWCAKGYSWDAPVWTRGVFRMTGKCNAEASRPEEPRR